MIQLAECRYCGEYRRAALREINDTIICYNCSSYAINKTIARCHLCEKMLPCEVHHVYGRRKSPLTIPLCCNCHRYVETTKVKRVVSEYFPSVCILFFLQEMVRDLLTF
jgi:hypothetical protein